MRRAMIILLAIGLATPLTAMPETLLAPDMAGRLSLVPTGGVSVEGAPAAAGALVLRLNKTGPERRMIAVEATPQGRWTGARSMIAQGQLTFDAPPAAPPKLAAVVFERDGDAWVMVSPFPLPTDRAFDARLDLSALWLASFSTGDGELDWSAVDRLWLGFVLDGPAQGEVRWDRLVLSDEPYRPTEPLPLLNPNLPWTISKQDQVTAEVVAAEDDAGQPITGMAFTLPGGQHRWMIPMMSVGEGNLAGFNTLRLVYRAQLPKGINGLLVSLHEQGGAQYFVDPPPPAAAEWTTLDIPWERFILGGWSQDANGRLDLGLVRQISIGVHGQPAADGGGGFIELREVALVP